MSDRVAATVAALKRKSPQELDQLGNGAALEALQFLRDKHPDAFDGVVAHWRQTGWPGVESLIATLDESEVQSRNQRPRYKAYQVHELAELPSVDWLIEGLIPELGHVVIYGPTKEHKTFVSLDMALCIATGLDYCGRSVKQQRVLYIIAEGQSDFYNRIKAWCIVHDIAVEDLAGQFEVIQDKIYIDDLVNDERLRDALFDPNPGPYGLIVTDTVNRNMSGSESDTVEMSKFVKGCEAIKSFYRGTVMNIHHTGWDKGRMRGSTALPSAADANISVSKDKSQNGRTTMTVDEARFGPDGWSLVFDPRKVVTDSETLRDSLVMNLVEEVGRDDAPSSKRSSIDELLVRIVMAGGVENRVVLRDPNTKGFSKAQVDKNIKRLVDAGWVTEAKDTKNIRPTNRGRDRAAHLGFEESEESEEL